MSTKTQFYCVLCACSLSWLRYGTKDTRNISNFVGTRTSMQVRTHAQKWIIKQNKLVITMPFISLWLTDCLVCTQADEFKVNKTEPKHTDDQKREHKRLRTRAAAAAAYKVVVTECKPDTPPKAETASVDTSTLDLLCYAIELSSASCKWLNKSQVSKEVFQTHNCCVYVWLWLLWEITCNSLLNFDISYCLWLLNS